MEKKVLTVADRLRQRRMVDLGATPEKRRSRKPTLASVVRQAAKAGLQVARYEVAPDGRIVVVTGKADAPKRTTWDDLLEVKRPPK